MALYVSLSIPSSLRNSKLHPPTRAEFISRRTPGCFGVLPRRARKRRPASQEQRAPAVRVHPGPSTASSASASPAAATGYPQSARYPLRNGTEANPSPASERKAPHEGRRRVAASFGTTSTLARAGQGHGRPGDKWWWWRRRQR